jgi:hypothetical protein
MKKLKAVIVKAREGVDLKVGDQVELTPEEFAPLYGDGYVVTATEWQAQQEKEQAQQATVKAREAAVDNAIKASRAFAPKDEAGKADARGIALQLEERKPGSGVQYIQNMPALNPGLGERAVPGGEGVPVRSSLQMGEDTFENVVQGYFKASEPFEKQLRNGGIVRATRGDEVRIAEAVALARVRSSFAAKMGEFIRAGADLKLADVVKAGTAYGTDYVDPASNAPLGTLNTGLTLLWNLGNLENQLIMLNDIVTDISNTPVLFNQYARTRYIQVPGVQLKTYTNAWSGTTGTDVDVNVLMDTYAGVPITVNNVTLSSTTRQLLNEQKAPQLYGLGEYIIYKLVYCIVNGSTRIANDGHTTSTKTFTPGYTNGAGGHTFSVAGATLATFLADLPEAMDESKFPGGDETPGADLQRFAWVHGRLYANLASDTNYLLNQSIWGAVAKMGGNLLETGRLERIGNTTIRKSQLMSDQCTTSGSGADGGDNAMKVAAGTITSATTVGFCGTRNALLFVSRVPLDYTKVMPEVPSTAAVELVTSPKLGITFMVVKYLDHGYENANMRAQLMFGVGVGDERQGMLLNQK